MIRRTLTVATLGVALHGFAGIAGAADVVATGLSAPRGLDFAPNGQLFVAEAGKIRTAPPCVAGPMGSNCYTETGSISLIDPTGTLPAKRVVTDLPTLGDVGPADISFLGMKAHVVIGLGADPSVRTTHLSSGAKASDLSSLISVEPKGSKPHSDYTKLADLGAYEVSNNPAGGPIDSNPFGVLSLPGRTIAVDAGANAVIEVKANGATRTLAVFPSAPRDRVPSRVTLGPDGYIYVGEEAFGAGAGQAHIYKVPLNGCEPVTSCETLKGPGGATLGFTTIMDLEFDRNGNLYVLQFGPGNLLKVDPQGNVGAPVYSGLTFPGGMALSPNGDYAYVSNFGVCYGEPNQFGCGVNVFGQVLRIAL